MTDPAGIEGGPCECAPCRARAQKRTVRSWRWITRLDLTRPPAPILRWALLLILGLCCWAAGIPLDIKDWLGPIIIAGALILPDVAGFGIAGMRLDLKQAQDEIATLRQEVNAQARATAHAGAVVAMGDKALEAVPGLSAIGEIVNVGRPGAAATARPLSTDGSEMDASDEERVPS